MSGYYDHATGSILHTVAMKKLEAAEIELQAARELIRPFMILKPRVFPDGNKWCVLYGNDLQYGVCAFGDTPEQASINFDNNWKNQITGSAK